MNKIAMAVAAAIAMLGGQAHAADDCKLAVRFELPVTMRGTRPLVPASLDGKQVMFLADSGAFMSTLSPAVAQELKLDIGNLPGVTVGGVGGQAAYAAYARVPHFVLNHADYPNIYFMVTPGSAGDGTAGLIGQNIWGLGDVEYDLQGGAIRVFKTDGCAYRALAYWAEGKPDTIREIDIDRIDQRNRHTIGKVVINGVTLRAIFDTGASSSVISLRAAEKAGVTPTSPGVNDAGASHGIGDHLVRNWIGTFASFKVGDEEIVNARIRFGTIGMEDTDMLLGADFFLSHRVFVANSQHRLYFTYNGGPVFNVTGPVNLPERPVVTVEGAGPGVTPDAGKTGADDGRAEPTTADGFARRGAGLAARHDNEHALTDLDRAIQLAPNEPRYYLQRAAIQIALKHTPLAKADLDQAVKLQPDNSEALLDRAELNLATRERTAAVADLDAAASHTARESDARLTIANFYMRMSLFQKAIDSFSLWIDAHGDEVQLPTALSGRCWARAQLGIELDKALGDCNRAAGMAPTNLNIRAYRGLVQLRRNALDDALADDNAVLAKNPKAPWALYGKGIIELRRGMRTEGEADIAAAKAAAPNLAAEAAERGIVPPN